MTKRKVAAALVAAAIAAQASLATAQMMGGGGMGFFGNGMSRGTGGLTAPANMQATASAWLSGLHAQLQLDASQEPAWQAFANAVTAQAAAMQSMRTQMLQSNALTAPQRVTLAEQLMTRRLDTLGPVADSLAALYARLAPAQRALLDEAFGAQCGAYGLFGS